MSAAVPDPERAVVGAVLLAATPAEAARLMATAGDLEAGHFRHSLAGAAWRAERELVQAGRLPDAVSIAAALARVNGRGNPHAFVGSLLDGLPHVGDLAQWASLIRNEAPAGERSGCAWARAVAAPEFCAGSEADIAWIERPFLAPGVVTLWFSPRGLGKTLIAHEMAVRLAQRGKRVLLIDRDNPRAETRRRLRRWGATDAPLLRVLGRDGAPPLTART